MLVRRNVLGCFALIAATVWLPTAWSAETVTTIRLPTVYQQVAFAGNGRFVAFHLESPNKVLVYDITTGKVAFEVDDVSPGQLLAGSSEKLVIYSPAKMILRRFDLKTGQRDKVAIVEGNDAARLAVMGCASKGPLLLVGDQQSTFFNLETLEPIRLKGPKIAGRGRYGQSVQVSADGQTFGVIPTGYGPVGYSIFRLNGKTITQTKFGGTSNAIRWAQPTADGYLVMQPAGDVVNGNGRTVKADWLKGAALIPSTDAGYFIATWVDQRDQTNKPVAKLMFCSTADCQAIHTRQGFEEIVPAKISSWHDIVSSLKSGHRWRVHWVPQLNRLVTLPADNRRMMIRSLDLEQHLKAGGEDYLYVRSTPPLRVTPGETMRYRIEVASSKKKPKMTIAGGPADARLRKEILQWQVPADFEEPWARFLVSIRGGDREILHSFEVAIESPTRPQ